MSAYTYLLRCSDGTLYCGWTDNIEKRLAAHNAGTALIYFETFDTKQEAMSREARIKQLSRREKLALVNPPRD